MVFSVSKCPFYIDGDRGGRLSIGLLLCYRRSTGKVMHLIMVVEKGMGSTQRRWVLFVGIKQEDIRENRVDTEGNSIGWMTGILFVTSFVGLLALVSLKNIEQYKAEIKRLQESEAQIKALSVNYAALLKEREDRISRLNDENSSLKKNLDASRNESLKTSASSPSGSKICGFLAGLFHSNLIKRVLVVAPKTLLPHWMKELDVVGLSQKAREYFGTCAKARQYELQYVLQKERRLQIRRRFTH